MASVIVVDDHPLAGRAASALVGRSDSLELVGERVRRRGAGAGPATESGHRDHGRSDARARWYRDDPASADPLSPLRVVLISTERAADLPSDLADCGAAGFLSKQDLTVDTLVAMIG